MTQRFSRIWMSSTVSEASSLLLQRTTDQERKDRIVPLSFQGRAVGHGEQFLCLLPGQPVPHPGSLLPDVGDVGQV